MGSNFWGSPRLCLSCLLYTSICCSLLGQLDSAFVETLNEADRVNGGLRYRDNSARFQINDMTDLELLNRGLSFRVGGRYKWLGYTLSIPLSDLGTGPDQDGGSSLGLNLQLFRPRYYVNLAGRRTVGFRQERVGEEAIFRRDIGFTNLLAFGFYVLNYRKFSIRSAFRQRDRQLRSSGSWLLGGLLHRQVLDANVLTVPFGEDNRIDIDRFSQTKLGIGGGYSYTFVWGRSYFFTPLLIAGPEVRFVSYDPRTGQREAERLRFNIRVRSRLAAGINTRRTYLAVIAAYLPSIDNTESFNVTTSETRVELALGYRFGVGKDG